MVKRGGWLRAAALLLALMLALCACGVASSCGHECDDPFCCAICRSFELSRQLSLGELPPALLALGLICLCAASAPDTSARRAARTLVTNCVELND